MSAKVCPVCEVRETAGGVIEHAAGCLQDSRDTLLKIMALVPRDCNADDDNDAPTMRSLVDQVDKIHQLLYGCSCSYADDMKENGMNLW